MPVLGLDNKKSSKSDKQGLAQAEKRLADMFSSLKIPIIPKMESMTVHRLKSYQEILLEEQNDLLASFIKQKQEKSQSENQPFYNFDSETKTFVIQESRLSAVNFSAKSGNDDMALLFGVFYDCFEERGVIQKNYKTVFVSAAEIINKLGEKGKSVDMNWIKTTRSNIVNHKIPKHLASHVIVSGFDKKLRGYYFKIKISNFSSNAN